MEVELGDLYLNKGSSLDPAKYPEETFEYYSIPAYDIGEPEIILGSEIGSSKKVFQPNDIILSRIVPHIRRCWVVGSDSGYRQIGSGEWITFRTENIEASYLRHYLMSNEFNAKFLKTIKGVGGSLMRADPKQVGRFKINLPPLDQQKKIAAILDAADAYRQKTKALIEKYDELTQSLFLDMFGDPVTNPKGFNEVTIGEVIDLITYGLTVRPEYHSKGIPLISAREIRSGKVDLSMAPKISVEDFENLSVKGKPLKGDVLFSKTGSIGHCAIVEEDTLFAVTQNAARIVFKETINRTYAIYFLRTPFIQTLSQRRAKGNAVKDLQLGEMKKFKFILPPIELQNQFAERVQTIELQKAQAQASLAQAEDLFNSLLQRAFKGELTT